MAFRAFCNALASGGGCTKAFAVEPQYQRRPLPPSANAAGSSADNNPVNDDNPEVELEHGDRRPLLLESAARQRRQQDQQPHNDGGIPVKSVTSRSPAKAMEQQQTPSRASNGQPHGIQYQRLKTCVTDCTKVPDAPRHQVTSAKRRIRKMLFSEWNPTFAGNAELSLRAALFVLISGIPFLVPKDDVPTEELSVFQSMYNVGVVTFICFNLSSTLGSTICNCLAGLRGVGVAILATWFMHFCFPRGVPETRHDFHEKNWMVWTFGWTFGALFVIGAMSLNFAESTKIFSINYFVGWWMSFMRPGDDGFHCPWTRAFDLVHDTGVKTMFTLSVGAALVIAASLLPYPLLALTEAKETSEELVLQLIGVWRRFYEYLSAEEKNEYLKDQVFNRLKRFNAFRTSLAGHIDDSWWECLGMGRGQKIRRQLRRVDQAVADICDCLHTVWVTAVRSDTGARAWTQEQKVFMKKVSNEMMDVVEVCDSVLVSCTRAACAGVITADEERALQRQVAELREKDARLAAKFLEARQSVHRGASSLLMLGQPLADSSFLETLNIPHTFGFNLSRFSKVVCDLAEDLIKAQKEQDPLPVGHFKYMFLSTFEGVTANAYRLWTARSLATIFSAFLMGYAGWGTLLGEYNAGIAGTVSVLLTRYTGSAIVNNLGRIQGVVLGTVAGQMIHAVFSVCAMWSTSLLGAMAFIYALATMYVARSSKRYASVGLLACVFGIDRLFSGECAWILLDKDHKVLTYDRITTTMTACLLVVFWDLVLPATKASQKAQESVHSFFDSTLDALREHFDQGVEMTTRTKAELVQALDDAATFNEEADNECRMWSREWQTPVFNRILALAHHLHSDLQGLEICMTDDFKFPGKKNTLLKDMLRGQGLPQLGQLVQERTQVAKDLMVFFGWTKEEMWPGVEEVPDIMTSHRLIEVGALDQVVEDMKKLASATGTTPVSSLQLDPHCQLSVCIASTRALLADLSAIQHEILRAC